MRGETSLRGKVQLVPIQDLCKIFDQRWRKPTMRGLSFWCLGSTVTEIAVFGVSVTSCSPSSAERKAALI